MRMKGQEEKKKGSRIKIYKVQKKRKQ